MRSDQLSGQAGLDVRAHRFPSGAIRPVPVRQAHVTETRRYRRTVLRPHERAPGAEQGVTEGATDKHETGSKHKWNTVSEIFGKQLPGILAIAWVVQLPFFVVYGDTRAFWAMFFAALTSTITVTMRAWKASGAERDAPSSEEN